MEQIISKGVEEKKKLIEALIEKIKNSKTILIVSTKNLPSSQFQTIKKKLRGKAEIRVLKKSIVLRAIGAIEKGALQNLKSHIGADIALLFSDLDAFELSGLLSENESPAKAKAGDIANEDIKIEPGPTDLIPGPAISELSSVGLKVAVEGGKLTIKQGAVIVKKDSVIDEKVASVLGKLNILPMKVGFVPVAAYDSRGNMVYADIIIDKKGTLEILRENAGRSFGFAVNRGYICAETIKWFIMRAGMEEKSIERIVNKNSENARGSA